MVLIGDLAILLMTEFGSVKGCAVVKVVSQQLQHLHSTAYRRLS